MARWTYFTLYCIFLGELLDRLSSSGVGVYISVIYCGSPMYADDILLIAASPTALQFVLILSMSTHSGGDIS